MIHADRKKARDILNAYKYCYICRYSDWSKSCPCILLVQSDTHEKHYLKISVIVRGIKSKEIYLKNENDTKVEFLYQEAATKPSRRPVSRQTLWSSSMQS